MLDKNQDKCGVFGIFGHPDAARLAYLGLYSLQHRGQESAGIVVSDEKNVTSHKGMGLVSDVFNEDILKRLHGHIALGHVRYSTTGSSFFKNAQPLVVNYHGGSLAVAHNGNFVNALKLRNQLEKRGSIFQSSMDTEVVVHLIASSKKTEFEKTVIDAFEKVEGAYSILLMDAKRLIGIRDPYGFRPLCIGKLGPSGWIVTSETCALDLIGAEYIRDVEPGEMVVIDKNGIASFHPFPKKKHAFCAFEFIYFSRPDSNIFGQNVYIVRKRLGKMLAKESPADVDFVIPVPDSGISAALGFSEESGIPFETGIIRNHYIGRTFIQPHQFMREVGVRVKLNPVREVLEGKKIVVVDDSIVRGTSCKKIIKMLYSAGAKEIHLRISSPPSKHPCFYGIDTPQQKELIAANIDLEDIRKYLKVDSLAYLSMDGLKNALHPGVENSFCFACFDGKYPIDIPCDLKKYCLEETMAARVEQPLIGQLEF
ncbi:MAG: amidophosphoribosyltransferase [bacterium]